MQTRISGFHPAGVTDSGSLPRPAVWRVVGAQGTIAAVVAIALLFGGTVVEARSALFGGLLAVIPNAIFVSWAFRHAGARQAPSMVSDFYIGEALKFVATVIGFGLVFVLVKPLSAGWLFATYIASLCVYWVAPSILAGGRG